VIHCSAGIGRTGTLLCLYNIYLLLNELKEAKEEIKISIFGLVRRLREQRWGMVQTKEQYKFLYEFTYIMIQKLFDKPKLVNEIQLV